MPQPTISRRAHAATDYSYIPTVLMLPKLAGFEDERTAVTLTRVLAGGILLSSVLTRSEWGLLRMMPYKAHVALDAGVGLFAAACPWLFGFADHKPARDAFLAIGATGLAVGALSSPPREMPPGEGDFESAPAPPPPLTRLSSPGRQAADRATAASDRR